MNKIYLVISECGEYEDYFEYVEKAFVDLSKAEGYKNELEDQELIARGLAVKCRDCGGLNKECPFYQPPFSNEDDCENYQPYHDNVTYRIQEVELEE